MKYLVKVLYFQGSCKKETKMELESVNKIIYQNYATLFVWINKFCTQNIVGLDIISYSFLDFFLWLPFSIFKYAIPGFFMKNHVKAIYV